MNLEFLGGLGVVESSAFTAAPPAGMSLGQFGTDVIACTSGGSSDGCRAVEYTDVCASGFPAIAGGGSPRRARTHRAAVRAAQGRP